MTGFERKETYQQKNDPGIFRRGHSFSNEMRVRVSASPKGGIAI
jgi:hypothetical protein